VSIELPQKFEDIINNQTNEWFKKRGKTRDQLRSFIENRIIQDHDLSPKVGQSAPDFEAEKLDNNGKRTGEIVRLSNYFGKPVGLVFGSYT